MNWSLCPSLDAFLQRCGSALLANESEHNLTWGAIARARDEHPDEVITRFFVLEDPRQNMPYAVVDLERGSLVMDTMSVAQAQSLAEFLHQQGISLRSLKGTPEAGIAFAETWSKSSGHPYRVQLRQALMKLTNVIMPDPAGGAMIPATEDHRSLLEEFLTGFARDCFPQESFSQEQICAQADRLIVNDQGYLWRNAAGDWVGMAGVVRTTPHTSCLSLVYTVPKHRSHGYAARLVGTLSQAQLQQGKKACSLHTDLANPTSNAVYERVGYERIGTFVALRLTTET